MHLIGKENVTRGKVYVISGRPLSTAKIPPLMSGESFVIEV